MILCASDLRRTTKLSQLLISILDSRAVHRMGKQIMYVTLFKKVHIVHVNDSTV